MFMIDDFIATVHCRRETGNGCHDDFSYSSITGKLVSIATICDDGTQSVMESEVINNG